MKVVPIVLAGGVGERFWPLSRSSHPKQILRLVSSRTMVEETLARVAKVASPDVVPLIITGKKIARKLRSSIPHKWKFDMISEPVGKNTAPAIALAASWVRKRYGDSVMIVVSADHDIRPLREFTRAMKCAVDLAGRSEELVVFGIKPGRPETGYGYIQLGSKLDNGVQRVASYRVKRFVEKPDAAKAAAYVASGNYLWNSGIFVWRTQVILDEFREFMPDLYKMVQRAEKAGHSAASIDRFYGDCIKESIDYGIMERSRKVAAVVGSFEWDDIGSWEYVSRVYGKDAEGTTVVGRNIFRKSCRNSVVVNHSRCTIAAVGLDDTVVVATPDALLVMKRSLLPDVKKYLAEMKNDKNISHAVF